MLLDFFSLSKDFISCFGREGSDVYYMKVSEVL